ncbi:MAG: class I SAM-dependent methyltransferase [Neisseriaceae bacterium]|nr:class I SAM-dependent methyltransferase [Neisseriaceae bacterium]
MSVDALLLTPQIAKYLAQLQENENPILRQIREQTEQHRKGSMSAARETVALLVWLARLIGVCNYLEIGVFTGYSSTAIALILPENGHITACDINVTHTHKAQLAWQKAKVSDKITLHLQPAIFTLQSLLEDGLAEHFDMALIDADKIATAEYVELCLQLIRKGGIIAIDNVLLQGRIVDDTNNSPSLLAMRKFNQQIINDERIYTITLPMGDGVTLLIKK